MIYNKTIHYGKSVQNASYCEISADSRKRNMFTYFSAKVACSLIPMVNMTGVTRKGRPVKSPVGNEE